MAKITYEDHIKLGGNACISHISYQFSEDKDFNTIISEKLLQPVDQPTWYDMLKKEDGTYHKDLDKLYSRIKVHNNETESKWFTIEPYNQNKQTITVTENDITILRGDSLELGVS